MKETARERSPHSATPRKPIDIRRFGGNYVAVKLGSKEELILDILRQEEMYGLDIIAKSNGGLKHGTIYVHLSRMEDKRLIQARVELPTRPRGLPRRIYRVTEEGWRLFLERHSFLPEARAI